MSTFWLVILGSIVAFILGSRTGFIMGYNRGIQDSCAHDFEPGEDEMFKRCSKCGMVRLSGVFR